MRAVSGAPRWAPQHGATSSPELCHSCQPPPSLPKGKTQTTRTHACACGAPGPVWGHVQACPTLRGLAGAIWRSGMEELLAALRAPRAVAFPSSWAPCSCALTLSWRCKSPEETDVSHYAQRLQYFNAEILRKQFEATSMPSWESKQAFSVIYSKSENSILEIYIKRSEIPSLFIRTCLYYVFKNFRCALITVKTDGKTPISFKSTG